MKIGYIIEELWFGVAVMFLLIATVIGLTVAVHRFDATRERAAQIRELVRERCLADPVMMREDPACQRFRDVELK